MHVNASPIKTKEAKFHASKDSMCIMDVHCSFKIIIIGKRIGGAAKQKASSVQSC